MEKRPDGQGTIPAVYLSLPQFHTSSTGFPTPGGEGATLVQRSCLAATGAQRHASPRATLRANHLHLQRAGCSDPKIAVPAHDGRALFDRRPEIMAHTHRMLPPQGTRSADSMRSRSARSSAKKGQLRSRPPKGGIVINRPGANPKGWHGLIHGLVHCSRLAPDLNLNPS